MMIQFSCAGLWSVKDAWIQSVFFFRDLSSNVFLFHIAGPLQIAQCIQTLWYSSWPLIHNPAKGSAFSNLLCNSSRCASLCSLRLDCLIVFTVCSWAPYHKRCPWRVSESLTHVLCPFFCCEPCGGLVFLIIRFIDSRVFFLCEAY